MDRKGFLFLTTLGIILIAIPVLQDQPKNSIVQFGDTRGILTAPSNAKYGVILLHGFSASKEMWRPFQEKLANQGFAVLSFDFSGHGENPKTLGKANLTHEIDLAVSTMNQHTGITLERISLVGHSMGAGAAINYAVHNPPLSTVLIGNYIPTKLEVNLTNPGNLLNIMGKYDELFSVETMIQNFELAFGHQADLGTTYGSFENRTAHRVAVTPTNHIFELGEETTFNEVISWISKSSGKFTTQKAQFPLFMDILSSIGFFVLFVSVPKLILLTKLAVSEAASTKPGSSTFKKVDKWSALKPYFIHGTLVFLGFIASVPFLAFLPFQFLGLVWFSASAIVFWLRERSYRLQLVSRDMAFTFLVALLTFIGFQLFLLIWTWDFRITIPLGGFIPLHRYPLFIMTLLPAYLFARFEIHSLRTRVQERGDLIGIMKMFVARTWPFLVILFLQYLPPLLTNTETNATLGFLTFFIIGLVPIYAILTLISAIKPLREGDPEILVAIYLAWEMAVAVAIL